MSFKNWVGKKVEVLTEKPDGQGDVEHAWMDGTVVGEWTVPAMHRQQTGQQPGIYIKVPGCAYKDEIVGVDATLIDVAVIKK